MSKTRPGSGRARQSRMTAKGARKTDDGLYLQKDAEDMEFNLMDRVYAFSGTSFLSTHNHAPD